MSMSYSVVWELDLKRGLSIAPRDNASMVEFARWLAQTNTLNEKEANEK